MKKILFAFLFLCSSYSWAENLYDTRVGENNTFYAELFGGANFIQNTQKNSHYQTGYIISGSLGYRLCYGLRLEGEYAYRRNALKNGSSGHFQSSSYMANVLWDFSGLGFQCGPFYPFIGGGVGYDVQQIFANSEESCHDEMKDFAWQAMAGVAYPILCNADLFVEYKFHRGGFCHLYNHSIGMGISFRFKIGSNF